MSDMHVGNNMSSHGLAMYFWNILPRDSRDFTFLDQNAIARLFFSLLKMISLEKLKREKYIFSNFKYCKLKDFCYRKFYRSNFYMKNITVYISRTRPVFYIRTYKWHDYYAHVQKTHVIASQIIRIKKPINWKKYIFNLCLGITNGAMTAYFKSSGTTTYLRHKRDVARITHNFSSLNGRVIIELISETPFPRNNYNNPSVESIWSGDKAQSTGDLMIRLKPISELWFVHSTSWTKMLHDSRNRCKIIALLFQIK